MDLLASIETKEKEKIAEALEEFTKQHATTFVIPSLDTFDKERSAWQNLISLLNDEAFSGSHSKILEALKILSRNNNHLDSIISNEILNTLLVHASLSLKDSAVNQQHSDDKKAGILESQKCLYNLVLNHAKSREILSKTCMADAILERLSAKTLELQNMFSIYLFDLRILFILTAKCGDIRQQLGQKAGGLRILSAFLERCLRKGVDAWSDEEADLCIEALKILFNLLLPDRKIQAEAQDHAMEDVEVQTSLIKTIRAILAVDSESSTRIEELKSQSVNLLLNISPEVYEHLIPPGTDQNNYLGHDMVSITNLVEFLETRLNQPTRLLAEKLVPILSVLIQCSRSQRPIRKFLRAKILPPLRDVTQRPEEGNTLRNKLCRLMTSPVTQVENMVAEFLFVLCKENVGRLIKYTGYGNAAGLLAHRGLMTGRKADQVGPYSSDSDSDTEEYKKAEKHINPVTGAIEPKRPNPTEHMTEEQKEYEAVRLINMIDQLQRQGIIQPAKIGEDGKPQPIEHVLELQKDHDD